MERGLGYRALIGAALIVGALSGVALVQPDEPHYRFLNEARPIRVAEVHRGSTRGTLRIYNLRVDWQSLLARIEREMPLSLSKVGTYHGLPAETVVVPQLESGRAKLFETPLREITVVQGKFVRDKSGMEIARPGDGTWAGIRVVEFRQPHLLDTASEWIHDRLRV